MNFKKSKNVEGSIRKINAKQSIYLLLIMTLFSGLVMEAQTTPEPPSPPKTPQTSTSKSYSVAVENNTGDKHNSSVSVSVSDEDYKFKARYHQSKNEGIKSILIKELGKSNLNVNRNTYLWTNGDYGNDVFECKLTKGQLKIYLDTNVASEAFFNKIKTLGDELKYYISGTSAD